MSIRPARPQDADALWNILEPVIREGETYALDRDMEREAALAYWLGEDRETFVLEEDGKLAGSFYVRPNQAGGGRHVCNAGFMVAQTAGGRGIGRRLCTYALDHARGSGFHAMQFNFVVSTNHRAVHLWQDMGFAIVGRIPDAFAHPRLGLVEACVMYRKL